MIIGLTGGLGCGKSSVARVFSKLGFPVLSSDEIVHEIYRERGEVVTKLVEEFGEEILDSGGFPDREKLRMLLADPEQTMKLNRIVHPEVANRIRRTYSRLRSEDPGTILIVEAPLLYESGSEDWFDVVICVTCPDEEGMRRFSVARDIPGEDASRRARRQMPTAEKARRSHFVIDNSGPFTETRREIERLADILAEGSR